LIEEFRPKNIQVHLYPCDHGVEYRDELLHPEMTRFYHEPTKHSVQCIAVGKGNDSYTPAGKNYYVKLRWPCAMSREEIYMSREDMIDLFASIQSVLEDDQ
jgi:hypothetical protein